MYKDFIARIKIATLKPRESLVCREGIWPLALCQRLLNPIVMRFYPSDCAFSIGRLAGSGNAHHRWWRPPALVTWWSAHLVVTLSFDCVCCERVYVHVCLRARARVCMCAYVTSCVSMCVCVCVCFMAMCVCLGQSRLCCVMWLWPEPRYLWPYW